MNKRGEGGSVFRCPACGRDVCEAFPGNVSLDVTELLILAVGSLACGAPLPVDK